MLQLKQYTRTNLEYSWTQITKDIVANTLKDTVASVVKTAASWITSNSVKMALSTLPNSWNETDQNTPHTILFAMNSRLYLENLYDKKHPFPLYLPEFGHTATIPFTRPLPAHPVTKQEEKQQEIPTPIVSQRPPARVTIHHPPLTEETKSRRVQVFLNQIYPKQQSGI
jgi:hypothetical protein